MKKKIFFEKGEYIIFKDSQYENRFYGITRDINEEVSRITSKYDNRTYKVPDEIYISAKPFIYSKPKNTQTDVYVASDQENIDFPVNRIEWIWIWIEE